MVWWFRREPTKADLQAHKKVSIAEYKSIIRRVNPMLDFEPDQVPQIFDTPKRAPEKERKLKPAQARRLYGDMAAVLEAGVVFPRLVPRGRGDKHTFEDGVTAEDLLRYDDVGAALYTEIISWSLVQYRGLRGAIQFSANKAAALDAIARRYNQRPSDIVFSETEASPMERQAVDSYAAYHGNEAEKKAASKAGVK